MTLAGRCKHEFNTGDRNRGRNYNSDDMVHIEHVDENRLFASVEGTCQSDYDVAIDWSEAESVRTLIVNCSCPRFTDGWNCKHLWATLLEIDRQGLSNLVGGQGKLSIDIDESMSPNGYVVTASEMIQVPVSSLVSGGKTKQKKISRRRVKTPKTPAWQRTFNLLAQQTSSNGNAWNGELIDSLVAKKREAWYVLSVGQTVEHDSLIIEFFFRETKKNGEFGKTKQLKLNDREIDSFTNAEDRELLSQLFKYAQHTEYNSSYRYQSYGYRESATAADIPSSISDYLLPRLAATGRFVWLLDSEQPFEDAKPLAWNGDVPWQFEMTVTPEDKKKHWTIDGHFSRNGKTRPICDAVMATPTGLLLMDDTLFRLDLSGDAYHWLHAINASSPMEVPYKDRDLFLKQLWSAPALPKIELPENLRWESLHEPPQPKLKIYSPGKSFQHRKRLEADISFLYGSHEVKMQDPRGSFLAEIDSDTEKAQAKKAQTKKTLAKTKTGVTKNGAAKNALSIDNARSNLVYVRDRDAERNRLAELGSFGVQPSDGYSQPLRNVQFPQKRLHEMVDQLMAKGWQVEAEGKLYRSAGDFKIEVQSDIDWFELDASFDFDGVSAQLPELLAAVRKGENFVELGDGTRGVLPEKWLARYQHLADLGTVEDGKVRFKPSQALLLDAMLDEQENLRVDRKFSQFRKRLREFDGVKAKQEPKTFSGTLRDYQRDGLGWFHFLRELGLGGCLADDMGLGKTIQVLALLEHRRTRRLKKDEIRRPSLVVAPKSVVFNWIDEAKQFTPKLRVADYTGLDRKQRVGDLDDYHLVVTTYGTMRRDIAELKDQRFDYAILDESQAIKNGTSLSAKSSRLLDANHRLSLTGTPIENHLGELWSLFEFLNPGMLGRSGAFASLCKAAKPGEEGSLTDLSRAVAPFILRRTKDQVLKELPPKTEQMLHCDLLPKQRKQYDELRDYYRAKLTKKIDERGLKQSKIHVLEALLRLRQAACHPGLVDKKKTNQPSAKLNVLLEQIREIVSEGHKALVFSQFTSLLAIVRETLDKEKICYEYLDGRTRKRKEKVDRFQTDAACPLFLISLKAGGSGLNLTAADYVFILDPWWNPAVEAQAIDRTHRIGQKRPVFAYRIIARDTVEEKVLELQESKRSLANAIISADESLIRNLTADDLKLILS